MLELGTPPDRMIRNKAVAAMLSGYEEVLTMKHKARRNQLKPPGTGVCSRRDDDLVFNLGIAVFLTSTVAIAVMMAAGTLL